MFGNINAVLMRLWRPKHYNISVYSYMCVCVCVCACVRVCMRACVHACVRVSACIHMHVYYCNMHVLDICVFRFSTSH